MTIDGEFPCVHSIGLCRINVLVPTLTGEGDARIQVLVGSNIGSSVAAGILPAALGLSLLDRDGSPSIGDLSTLLAAILRSSANPGHMCDGAA